MSPNAENGPRGIDLRYCSAMWMGYCCDKRYDHEGSHRNTEHSVVWTRVLPPEGDVEI